MGKKLTDEEKAARVAAKAAAAAAPKEKKPRKVRAPGPKAPKRSEAPAMWAAYEVNRAHKIIDKIDSAITSWGTGSGNDFRDAKVSLEAVVARLASMPADFKPSRKGGVKSVFTIGQRVELSTDAMARVQQLFPDVKGDCVFQIATNAKPADKLLPVVCLGVDGSLAPFFVDRAPRKDLTPFAISASV